MKQKLDDLVKEEKRFQERQEKLGEWEKTQIAKMKEYEEKMIELVEREAKVDQIKVKVHVLGELLNVIEKDCLQKDAIRDKQMKELEEREAKFLEVVNTFTAERGKFEGERKEFHRWRRKEKRKIEDEVSIQLFFFNFRKYYGENLFQITSNLINLDGPTINCRYVMTFSVLSKDALS